MANARHNIGIIKQSSSYKNFYRTTFSKGMLKNVVVNNPTVPHFTGRKEENHEIIQTK
jgi:hypothetical protein